MAKDSKFLQDLADRVPLITRYQRAALICFGLLTLGYATAIFWVSNGYVALWSDEALSLFVANHSPFTKGFWSSLRTLMAGMPGAFWDFHWYLKLLEALPSSWLQPHLEQLIRLPSMGYVWLAIASICALGWTLTESVALTFLATFLLVIASPLTRNFSSELLLPGV